MKKATKAILGVASGVALAIGMSVPASAATNVQTWAINVAKSGNNVDYSRIVTSCQVGTAGATCSLTKGKQATRTVDLALGAARNIVSAQLGFSSATSVTISVTCTSPPMKPGQTWKGYAIGDRFTYRIHKRTTVSSNQGAVISTKNEYSGYLSAFNPYATSIYCRL